ncbi:MAG TPA: hypothetical protein VIF62_00335, partial [Labilithrix sp.]
MRRTRSKWLWVAAVGIAALAWQTCATCRSSDDLVDATIHVELASGATLGDSEPLFARSAEALAGDQDAAALASGESMPDLRAWRQVHVHGTRAEVDRALADLRARTDVVTVFEAPKVELPFEPSSTTASGSCPIRTPQYDERQGYIKKAPGGIDAPYAWKKRGGRGEAVWFADIEGAWNTEHEDVPGDRIKAIGRPMRSRDWEMHGTAVLGEVVSRENELGMVGIAPNVKRIVTSSVANASAADAIDRAQAELRAGDVLLIELHAIGPRGRFMPMELWDDVFDVI